MSNTPNINYDTIEVLYIVGAGRSGSTVLDTVLGNNSDVIGVGELSYLIEDGFKMGEKCSCGHPPDTCEFFSRVRDVYFEITGDRNFDKYDRIRSLIERPIMMPLVMLGLVPRRLIDYYCTRTEALFRAIHIVSGKRIILDSSKRPGRLAVLSYCKGLNVIPLHLVRDGRGYIWSKLKKQRRIGIEGKNLYSIPKSSLHSSFVWVLVNIASFIAMYYYSLRRKQNKRLFLSYEEFCRSPVRNLIRIGEMLSLNVNDIVSKLEKGDPFAVGHKIGGNRLKYKGIVKIKYDDEWRKKLPLRDRFIFMLIAWPMFLIYKLLYTGSKK